MTHSSAPRRWLGTAGRWPVWTLPPRLRWYVLAVIAAGAAASATAAALTRWRLTDALLYGVLLAFGAITVEAGRRLGDQAGGNKDTQGVWQLAAALLLPPVYALAAPVLVFALLQWRVRRSLAHRRVFSAAAVGLANGAAALAFHATGQAGRLLAVALPCGTLLHRSARHAQLVHASRTDPKTGLLSASAWQREASVHVTRAHRTRTPLALVMADIDHFKAVNDTYGHLAGDAVLAAVAAALAGGMRDYDLAGRFGGEEFTILLPHADTAEALAIAERMRHILAQIPLPATTPPGHSPPTITASLGVAVLGPGMTDLTDLIAAADTALYRAKHAGRNTVRLAGQPSQPGPAD